MNVGFVCGGATRWWWRCWCGARARAAASCRERAEPGRCGCVCVSSPGSPLANPSAAPTEFAPAGKTHHHVLVHLRQRVSVSPRQREACTRISGLLTGTQRCGWSYSAMAQLRKPGGIRLGWRTLRIELPELSNWNRLTLDGFPGVFCFIYLCVGAVSASSGHDGCVRVRGESDVSLQAPERGRNNQRRQIHPQIQRRWHRDHNGKSVRLLLLCVCVCGCVCGAENTNTAVVRGRKSPEALRAGWGCQVRSEPVVLYIILEEYYSISLHGI